MEQLDNTELIENFEKSRKLENHVKGGEIKIEENVKEEREREGGGGEEEGEGEGKGEGEGGNVADGGVKEIKGKCNEEEIVEIELAKI